MFTTSAIFDRSGFTDLAWKATMPRWHVNIHGQHFPKEAASVSWVFVAKNSLWDTNHICVYAYTYRERERKREYPFSIFSPRTALCFNGRIETSKRGISMDFPLLKPYFCWMVTSLPWKKKSPTKPQELRFWAANSSATFDRPWSPGCHGEIMGKNVASGYVNKNGDKWHHKWWFNGGLMVEEWVNNGEQWDDMGFTLW